MITEDYVSFETAKLLKEKGFDEATYRAYVETYKEHELSFDVGRNNSQWEKFNKEDGIFNCSAPTLQMAMKWLRNTFHLEIYPFHDAIQESNDWWYRIEHHSKGCSLIKDESDVIYKTYEQACEAGIKYCLENLI